MKPELRREQILRSATKVFVAKGYHRASVTDIIKGADIARGTFYLYFEGKREIFAELVDILMLRLQGCMKRVELGPDTPPWTDQIRSNLVRIATILIEDRELTQILYNHAMGLDEEFDAKIREFYEVIMRRTEGALKLGQQMELVRSDIDCSLAARFVVGSVKEVMYHAARQPRKRPSPEALVDEMISYTTLGLFSDSAENPGAPKRTRKK